jgi:hypothetical protein
VRRIRQAAAVIVAASPARALAMSVATKKGSSPKGRDQEARLAIAAAVGNRRHDRAADRRGALSQPPRIKTINRLRPSGSRFSRGCGPWWLNLPRHSPVESARLAAQRFFPPLRPPFRLPAFPEFAIAAARDLGMPFRFSARYLSLSLTDLPATEFLPSYARTVRPAHRLLAGLLTQYE